jgi:hypothetical protein
VAAETLFGATADQAYAKVHTEMGSIYGEFLPRSTVIALIPLHSVKVLHIAAIGLLERAGIPMRRAVILETCIAYVLIGVVVWLWLGVYLSAWSQAVAASMLMLMPVPLELARLGGQPDTLTAAFIIAGLYVCLYHRDHAPIGLGLLTLAVWTRFDAVIYCGVFLLLLMFTGRVRVRVGVLFGVLMIASVFAIYRSGYSHQEILAVVPTAGWGLNPLRNLLTSPINMLVVYAMFAVACWRLSPSRFEKALCLSASIGLIIHYALFPVPLTRYFAPIFFTWSLLGAPYIFGVKAQENTSPSPSR